MQREICKTLLTICNFQKKCERALAKRQSAIANCELRTANSNPAERISHLVLLFLLLTLNIRLPAGIGTHCEYFK